MKQVAIFAATRLELKAVSQACGVTKGGAVSRICSAFGFPETWQVWIFQTGVGSEKARRTLQRALSHHHFDLVISTGFACALSDSQVGDILIGSAVESYPQPPGVPDQQPIKAPKRLVDYSYRVGTKAGTVCRQGTFVSTLFAVGEARIKKQIGQETGAVGLDMESAALANAAREHNVDCLIVRSVSDLVDEDLPLDFNLFFQGGRQGLLGLFACIVRPSCWMGLNRLRKQSSIAADRMTAFFQVFFEQVHTKTPDGHV